MSSRALTGLLIAALAVTPLAHAVQPHAPITIERRGLATVYSQDGHSLAKEALASRLKAHPDAYRLFRRGERLQRPGIVLASIGGGLIGVPFLQQLAVVETHWILAAAGAGLVVTGASIGYRADQYYARAVREYNRESGAQHPMGVLGTPVLVVRWRF